MVTINECAGDGEEATRAALIAEGNSRFVDDDLDGARDCFTRANDAVSGEPSAQALSRRAAVHIKMENYEDAVADATRAIEIDASLAASYLRKGIACFELEEHEAALAAFQAGARLAPEDSRFKKWLRKAQAELEEQDVEHDATPARKEPAPAHAPAPTPPPQATSTPAPTPAAAPRSLAPAPVPSPAAPPPRFRHEWYQSAAQVVLTIFAKGVRAQDLAVDFGEQVLSVAIAGKPGEEPYVLSLRLFGKINPEQSKFQLLSTKVEVRLAKAEAIQWTGLEAAQRAKAAVVQPINESTVAGGGDVKKAYPSSSKHKVDWNKLEEEVKKEEKEEKLDGDAGLNKFFQEIYKDADEETRRAMNKSFVESQGTVLSTNWKDVGKGKVETKS